MPVRSKGKLLAGIGALLGVCAAGTGCQTTGMNNDPLPNRPATAMHSSPPANTGASLAAPVPAGVQVGQAGSAIRPVSATADDTTSAWNGTVHLADPSAIPGGYVTRTSSASPSVRASADGPTLVDVPTTHPAPVQQMPPIQPVNHMVFHKQDGPIEGVAGVPKEFSKESYPIYRVEPPDVLYIIGTDTLTNPNPQPLRGPFLIRMDGTINLGIYGDVRVAGLTLEEVKDAIAIQLKKRIDPKVPQKRGDDGKVLPKEDQPKDAGRELTVEQIKLELQVDVQAFNSKVYYIITDGAGYGEQVVRIPATGNETVLDALGLINGLPGASSKKRIWIARATPEGCAHPMILPVDWCAITQYGSATTNYQIFPGDRIYVDSQKALSFANNLDKFLRPVNSLLSTILLGSGTVNSIKNPNGVGGQ